MPATARRNQGKTEFVKEVLTKNPRANAQAVRAGSDPDGA